MSLVYEDNRPKENGMIDIFMNLRLRPLAAQTTNVNCLENCLIESDSVLIIYRGNGGQVLFCMPTQTKHKGAGTACPRLGSD
jgi:hypothetical protein